MFLSLKSQAGSVGILAIIVLALLGAVGGGMAARASNELNIASSYRDGIAAQYLAESGVQWAIAQIKANTAYRTTGSVINLNSGSITVTVEDIPDSSKRIISVGKLRGFSRSVVMVWMPESEGGGNFSY